MPADKVTIKIPRPLYEKVQKVIKDSGFNSPTDFIVFVLRDILGQMSPTQTAEDLSQEELAAIRRRLKSLGYL